MIDLAYHTGRLDIAFAHYHLVFNRFLLQVYIARYILTATMPGFLSARTLTLARLRLRSCHLPLADYLLLAFNANLLVSPYV
jgi:hypothetical protein